MIKKTRFFWGLVLLFSCTVAPEDRGSKEAAPMSAYFYPQRDSALIYCYRNVTDGLDEEFHRVFTIKDSSEHIVVERYSSSKRFLEAFNYDANTLEILEHIVVNRNNEREISKVYHQNLFPKDLKNQFYFASKFSGINDSTLILKENKRNFLVDSSFDYAQQGAVKARVFSDSVRQTLINVVAKNEKEWTNRGFVHFAEGIGPVEWYGSTKKVHYKLEKIISQKEWVRLMQF